jgi:hypothetical protein
MAVAKFALAAALAFAVAPLAFAVGAGQDVAGANPFGPLGLTGGGRRGLVDGRNMPTMNHNLQRWLVLSLAVASLLAVPAWAQSQPGANEMNPEITEMLSTNPPPKGFATRLDYIKSFTSEKKIIDAYHSGKIDKNEAMLAMEMNPVAPGDKASMDIYGKVVDQDGQPIVGAKVRGSLEFEMADSEEHDTKTDTQGQFHFLGLHGQSLGIFPEKDGYEFNQEIWFAANASRPANYLPDPKNPLLFHMWKLHGGEPMSHATIESFVTWDGNFKQFDLYESLIDRAGEPHPHGTDSNPLGTDGELMVKATRGIEFTNNGIREFNWTATLEITNGGLIAFNEPYPYIAPSEGYQTSVTLAGPTNFVDWGNGLRQGFYFKSSAGQAYGRMVIRMRAGRNHASFDADIYLNPTNSRNLEFDWSKHINLGPRPLSEATVRLLATKHRDKWLSYPAQQSYRYAPIFAKSPIVSVEKILREGGEKGGWHVTFVTPGDNKPAAPEVTNDYRYDYRFYIDLLPDGQFTRAYMGAAIEYVVAGKDTTWGSSVLHIDKIDNSGSVISGIRIITKEPDGQVRTLTASEGRVEQLPDLNSVKISLKQAHLETATTTTNFLQGYSVVILHL